MTTSHVRRVYRDGPDGNTPIEAAGINADQDTLVGLANDVSDLSDAVGNAGSGTTLVRIAGVGTTAERVSATPTIGSVYVNTERKVPEWGWGTEWRNSDGSAITTGGGTGTANAPTGMTAIVNPDNSIDVSWTAPVGVTVTSYNLYELRQPTVLASVTTTSSHRTPGGTGYYEYWVTAVIAGVESAASNHASASLPYGTTPGSGGGSTGGGAIDTPSEILRLGNEGGHWSIDVGYPSGNTSKDMSLVEDGWSDTPYFLPTETNTGVQYRVPMNGGTTSGSTYPRVELRERNADGSKADWNANSGTHSLSGTSKVMHFPPNKPEVVVAQIHDDQQDLIQIRVENDKWILSVKGVRQTSSPMLTGYSLGTYVSWQILVNNNGTITIKLNGTTKYSQAHSFGAHCYFKTGNYAQTNTAKGNSASEYVTVVQQKDSLLLSHS